MESNTLEGSYRDEQVAAMIKSHNLRLRGLEGFDNPGSISPY